MNMKFLTTICFLVIASLFLLLSCKKDFLDAKYDKRKNVPSTVKDYQALLDNTSVLNAGQPIMGEYAGDDYEILFSRWQNLTNLYKYIYIWSDELEVINDEFVDWTEGFRKIYIANVVLDGLSYLDQNKVKVAERNEFDNVKGGALFYRGSCYYQLAQEFCKQYEPQLAEADLGLPIRLTSDLNIHVDRSTLSATYKQMLDDLHAAAVLLPATVSVKTRPSKAAAYAMLAKVYLQMGDYANSLKYADSCLILQHELQDLNELNLTSSFPFAMFNKEVIFHATLYSSAGMTQSNALVSEELYQQYENNDLRKIAYFKTSGDRYTFKGSFAGSAILFGGITTAELFLIRAESNVRLKNIAAGKTDLLNVLTNRYRNNNIVLGLDDQQQLLAKIKEERRKELVFRGIRWSDIRRYNVLDKDDIKIVRNLNGQAFELKPMDKRFVFPFPKAAIDFGGYENN